MEESPVEIKINKHDKRHLITNNEKNNMDNIERNGEPVFNIEKYINVGQTNNKVRGKETDETKRGETESA